MNGLEYAGGLEEKDPWQSLLNKEIWMKQRLQSPWEDKKEY